MSDGVDLTPPVAAPVAPIVAAVPIICWIGLAPTASKLCCVALPIGPATAIRPNCLPMSPLACNNGLVATDLPSV